VQGNANSTGQAISADGRYVVFSSEATNLISGDSNNTSDVFRKDLLTGEILLASSSTNGLQGNGFSNLGAISADGRFVFFKSNASNLVQADTNNTDDLFRKDMVTG
jgi:Tol biopolymer transport system component